MTKLALKDPSGADWNTAALIALGASSIAFEDDGVIVAPDLNMSGYAAASAQSVDDLKAYVRSKSYDIRVAGTTINGVPVKTDDAAIAMISGMNGLAQQDSTETFDFDTGGDPVHLTAAQAIALATAVAKWVQSTFSQRAAILTEVSNGTLKTTADIDAAFAASTP